MACIPAIDRAKARFDLANEGYTYRDCFVLVDAPGSAISLLLLFQKNQRDETPVPCPTCRSPESRAIPIPALESGVGNVKTRSARTAASTTAVRDIPSRG